MKKYLIGSLVACTFLSGAGFKVPEQSSDSLALLNSNVAKSFGADAAYLNPANMIFLDDPRHQFETSLTYFQLDNVKYTHNDGKKYASKKAKALVPAFHFVSPEYMSNLKFGLSLVVPAGMSMRWDEDLPKATSKKFDLKVVELNPSIAYRVTDSLAIGFGLRAVYTKGEATQDVAILAPLKGSQNIKGDGVNFGYNIALTYKPIEKLNVAATYRSKVDMKLKGDTEIYAPALGLMPSGSYIGKAKLNVPLPASLNLALSYEIKDTTIMFAYEKTYWSAWKELNFDYPDASADHSKNRVFKAFDESKTRNWKDTSAYRFGVSHNATSKLRVMASVVFDEAASLSSTTSFDLPDTKATTYATGINYKVNDDLELAAGYFYQDRKKRDVKYYGGHPHPNGTFEKGNAQAINLGVKYKF
ncbi:OmpP1/FadL family transporter [Campylobacter sp. MOP51]|uniref:OmpP1/FadL family transporter n=1 Tax=Campylobacter canis TaxID=3378588 RepID=UPI003C34BE1D